MSIDKIIVFDDVRQLKNPDQYGVCVVHCRTENEFLNELVYCSGQNIQVLLDHDLGGQQLDAEHTSRMGILKLIEYHLNGYFRVQDAIVITANPAGRQWIIAELTAAHIPTVVDIAGRQIGMIAPETWQ